MALSRMARRREEEEEQDSVRHDVTMAVQQKVPVPLQIKGAGRRGEETTGKLPGRNRE